MRRLVRTIGCSLLLVSSVACKPDYGGMIIEPLSTPPVTVTVQSTLIEMPAGIAIAIEARPRSSSSESYPEGTRVDLISQDREVLVVQRREDRRQFVLVGVAAGDTCLEVQLDGDAQECIEVSVQPQS